MSDKLRVAVIGAGRWSTKSHLPGLHRSPLCDLVTICDLDRELAEARAGQFEAQEVETDYQKVLARSDIDVVDIVTRGEHEDLVFEVLEAGKHCLVEKPVCHRYQDVWRAHELAESKGLKTKVGLTFRFAPSMLYMFDLIRDGFIGRPFIFNGYEQNSQWLDPDNPIDKRIHKTRPIGEPPRGEDPTREGITVSSLEGYGAPIIDIGLECIGSDLTRVSGILSNMVPERRRTNPDTERERINVDDADMFMAEAENGALFSIQSSYVTVGNYPGSEARVYGSEGAIHVRLVEEFGVIETIHTAKPDAVEFVQQESGPGAVFPPRSSSRRLVGDGLLRKPDPPASSRRSSTRPRPTPPTSPRVPRVQEIINAVELSHRTRQWVDLPLEGKTAVSAQDRGGTRPQRMRAKDPCRPSGRRVRRWRPGPYRGESRDLRFVTPPRLLRALALASRTLQQKGITYKSCQPYRRIRAVSVPGGLDVTYGTRLGFTPHVVDTVGQRTNLQRDATHERSQEDDQLPARDGGERRNR